MLAPPPPTGELALPSLGNPGSATDGNFNWLLLGNIALLKTIKNEPHSLCNFYELLFSLNLMPYLASLAEGITFKGTIALPCVRAPTFFIP